MMSNIQELPIPVTKIPFNTQLLFMSFLLIGANKNREGYGDEDCPDYFLLGDLVQIACTGHSKVML